MLNNRRPQQPEPEDFLVLRSQSATRDDSFCKPDNRAIFDVSAMSPAFSQHGTYGSCAQRGWTFGMRSGAILVAYKPTTVHLPHKVNINEFKAHPTLRGMALVTSVTTASAYTIYLGTRCKYFCQALPCLDSSPLRPCIVDSGLTLKLLKPESPDGVPTWEADRSGGIYKSGSPKAAVQVFYNLKQCLPVIIGYVRTLAKPANNWSQ